MWQIIRKLRAFDFILRGRASQQPADDDLMGQYFRLLERRSELQQQVVKCTEQMADLGMQINHRESPWPERIRMRPCWISRCEDCRNITPEGGKGAMFDYLVTDELWEAVSAPYLGIMLCLRCLQKRIGRPMTLEDFPAHEINRDDERRAHLVEYGNNHELDDPDL